MRNITNKIIAIMLIASFTILFPCTMINAQSEVEDDVVRVEEVSELRDKNSDTFLLSDGSYECVIYGEDKYFLDNDGCFCEINNEVVPIDKPLDLNFLSDGELNLSEYQYVNADNCWKSYFSTATPSIKLQYKDELLSCRFVPSYSSDYSCLINNQGEEFQNVIQYTNNSISYIDKNNNVDLIYSVHNHGLKEYIILKNPDIKYLTFELDVSKFHIIKDENGTIGFFDYEGECVFELGSLFAIDSNGTYSEMIEYEIENCNDDTALIKISTDKGFFEGEPEYPVLIDPSVMVTGEYNTYDSYVSSRYPTTNYYLSDYLRTGRDDDFYIRRSYIKFDLPSYINYKNYSNVTSVCLDIRLYSGSTPNVKAYMVKSDWSSSTITWKNKPSYNTKFTSSTATYLSNDWYRINITKIAKEWFAGEQNNYGVVLKDETESGVNQWSTFYSSDAESPNKPELHIFYKEGQYLDYGYESANIYFNKYSYEQTWQTAMNKARNAWNTSSAPVTFSVKNKAVNRINVNELDETVDWYGVTTPSFSGDKAVQYTIVLNKTKITADAKEGYLGNFIQSVLVHELGHVVWLEDNPITPRDSIMKQTRDRNTMINPTDYDIENVTAKY